MLNTQNDELQQLRAINAAQAEQLAELQNKYEELRSVIDGGSESMTHADAVAALLQSTPAEPQAGVELTDALIAAEAVRKSLAEKYQQGIDTNSADMGGNCDWARLEGAVKVVQALRALNQRQAVKAEPVLGISVDKAGRIDYHDWVSASLPAGDYKLYTEPLSAAQGVPEYNWFVGKAGDEYIQSVAYKGQHTLPAQFRWNDLFNVLLKAALSAAPEQAEVGDA